MSNLKLNQLNKQKVAERELKDIEGGVSANDCNPLDDYGYFRLQMEYAVNALCNPLNGGGKWDDSYPFTD